MATLLRSSNFRAPPPSLTISNSLRLPRSSCICLRLPTTRSSSSHTLVSKGGGVNPSVPKFVISASSGESPETEIDTEIQVEQQQQPNIQDNTDGASNGETLEETLSDDDKPGTDSPPLSPVLSALKLYKEALDNKDEAKAVELEAFFKSIEDEKDALDRKVLSLSEDISVERERVLRISADFDNFRKRTERERLSLVTNAQGELIENFLPVVDNFERAKSQIKIETEAEQKISNSYQSIYKQFFEILSSIGVLPVDTVGKPFDPMLHEAIMREESTEYEEDVVIEEYRKGFKLGDRLLRPSMVKVSAGPGPEKPEAAESPSVEEEEEEDDVTEGGQIVEDDQTSS